MFDLVAYVGFASETYTRLGLVVVVVVVILILSALSFCSSHLNYYRGQLF